MATLVLAFGPTGRALAVPIYYSENGHYYERVDCPAMTGCTWAVAKASAEARSYGGVQGYLATITSAAEENFIVGNLGPYASLIHHWIGGYQSPGSVEPGGGWTWVTGETWNWTAWKPDGNPDNRWGSHGVFGGSPSGSDEEALCFWDDPSLVPLWNDADEFAELKGYVVEYVPEPVTLSLLAAGLGGLLLRRRRK